MDPTVTETGAQRPRGRPQRLPRDPAPPRARTVNATARMAWLLVTSRLLSPHTRGVSRSRFIEALRDRGVVVDSARLSRLESGQSRIDNALIVAYEQVTQLPEGALLAAHRLLLRSSEAAVSAPAPLSPSALAQLDAAFERAEAGQATGADWLTFGTGLAAHERTYLSPRTWTDLSDRLIGELGRASGIAHLRRYEAAAAMMSFAPGSRHVSLAIGRFVMHPHAQNVAPALGLLRVVDDESAGSLLVRLMSDEREVVRRAAREIAGSLPSFAGYSPERTTALERAALTGLRRNPSDPRHLDGLDLAVQLDEGGYAKVSSLLPEHRVRHRVLQARTTHELVAPDVARSVADEVASRAEAAVGRAAHDPDQMLHQLVREALFNARRERRHVAATVLSVSCYATAVSRAVFDLVTEEPIVAALGWSVLRRMGHVVSRRDVLPLALGEQRSGLRERALGVLGQAHGPVADAGAASLADDVLTGAEERKHGSLFALGMVGHDLLGTLVTKGDAATSKAAQWWTELGPALHDLTVPGYDEPLGLLKV